MNIFKKTKVENRTDTLSDLIESSLLGSAITKSRALEIPALKSCVEFISNTIAMLPVKLFKEVDGVVEEVKDKRTFLLNDETGDILSGFEFKKNLVIDYLIGKGGYAYIKKTNNEIKSLHYVNEEDIGILLGVDVINKEFKISVSGRDYYDFEFLKFLRNSKNGAYGKSIIQENALVLNLFYLLLIFERNNVSKGGNKKGFLESEHNLTKEAIEELKNAFGRLYSNENSESTVVLNRGIKFNESSMSSVEMQLNESKQYFASDVTRLFNLSVDVVSGNASKEVYSNTLKSCILPIVKNFECALNRDLLLENEKQGSEIYYFSFDIKELMKADISERYKAYAEGIKAGIITRNEARYEEDLEKIEGLDIITFSLGEVIYNIEKQTYFTPNTDSTMGSNFEKGEENAD